MPNFPKEIADFMEKYGVTSDEIWKIPQGSSYAIKHKALERVASSLKIQVVGLKVLALDLEKGIAAVEAEVVHGGNGLHFRSFGEACPKNNKNAYALAMAEKRAVDRAILKSLVIHGEIYSEDELDGKRGADSAANDTEAEQPNGGPPANAPKRTKVERETPDDPRYSVDQDGNPIDNIPWGDVSIERLPATEARADAKRAGDELIAHDTSKALLKWGRIMGNRVDSWPLAWSVQFRNRFEEHKNYLIAREQQEAA
jgi:hypothetical protein